MINNLTSRHSSVVERLVANVIGYKNSTFANPLGLTILFFNIKYLLFVASDSIGIDFSL